MLAHSLARSYSRPPSTGFSRSSRTRGFHCDFASEFVEYLGVRPRAACPYILSRIAVGIRVQTPTIPLFLPLFPPFPTVPSVPLTFCYSRSLFLSFEPSFRLLLRRIRFLIVSVRLFVSYLSSVLSLGTRTVRKSLVELLSWNSLPRLCRLLFSTLQLEFSSSPVFQVASGFSNFSIFYLKNETRNYLLSFFPFLAVFPRLTRPF